MSPSAQPGAFTGQAAVVAGAGSGIGRAAALRLARDGAEVACLDRDGPGAEATAATIGEAGGRASAYTVDVTAELEVVRALDVFDGGRVDVLVNCVGITGRTGVPAHEIEVDELRQVLEVNLVGAFVLSRAVGRRMLEQGYGRILHVASVAGKEGNAGMVSYSASKAGLIGLVKSQAKDYAGSGVTVNALAPAVIQTPLVEAMPRAQVEYMTTKIPMGRLGTLDEVAAMIAFAVSPEASFTTGFTYDLSGGRATY